MKNKWYIVELATKRIIETSRGTWEQANDLAIKHFMLTGIENRVCTDGECKQMGLRPDVCDMLDDAEVSE